MSSFYSMLLYCYVELYDYVIFALREAVLFIDNQERDVEQESVFHTTTCIASISFTGDRPANDTGTSKK
jgi:hypothetical protein